MPLNSPARQQARIRVLPFDVNIRGRRRRGPESDRITDYAAAADERLVEALEVRDERALETLYDRYGDYVYSVCLRMVGDVQLAEDLSQEVFLRLWRRPDLYDVGAHRDREWLERWLVEPDEMLREGDELATALLAEYKNIPMPNLRLAEKEVAALLGYIDQESRRIASLRAGKAARGHGDHGEAVDHSRHRGTPGER